MGVLFKMYLRSVVGGRASDNRRRSSSASGVTGVARVAGAGRARHSNGGVLNRGEDGGVALGDGSDRVSRADRADLSGRDGSRRNGGLATGGRVDGGDGGRNGVDLGGVPVVGGSNGGGDRADGGRDSDSLGGDNGAMGRAVGDGGGTISDGVHNGRVDG